MISTPHQALPSPFHRRFRRLWPDCPVRRGQHRHPLRRCPERTPYQTSRKNAGTPNSHVREAERRRRHHRLRRPRRSRTGAPSSALVHDSVEALFQQNCASCHGTQANGVPGQRRRPVPSPTFVGLGPATINFWVDSGRMPAANRLRDPVRGGIVARHDSTHESGPRQCRPG